MKLPEELREQVRPGDTLGVVVSKGKVTFVRSGSELGLSLREIIERVRCEPARAALDRLVWDRLERDQHVDVTA